MKAKLTDLELRLLHALQIYTRAQEREVIIVRYMQDRRLKHERLLREEKISRRKRKRK